MKTIDSRKIKAGICILMTALLVIGLSGCIELFDDTTDTSDTTTTSSCTFHITPAISASNGVLSADETEVNIPFIANTTSHTVDEGDNTTWVDPVITFTIKPKCPGSKTTNLANLNYEVTNPSQKVNADTGDHYLVTKSSNVWQVVWTGDGTEYVDGFTSMNPTENVTLTLTLDIDQTGLSYTQNTMDAQTVKVRLYNDNWSWGFEVNFVATLIGTAST